MFGTSESPIYEKDCSAVTLRLRSDKTDNMQWLMPKNATIPGGRLIEVEAAVTLARVRSFRAAAAELGLSPTSFSRAIAALEDRLGLQLFARTTRSVAPTRAGELFLARALPALHDLHLAMTDAQDERSEPKGTLRLTCAAGAARRILEPVLLSFLRLYPQMSIDLVCDPRMSDIVTREFDAGFRIGESVPRDMEKISIGPRLRSAVVASPAVVLSHGAPQNPKDLLHSPCIRFRGSGGAIYAWEFMRAGKRTTINVSGILTLDEPTIAHQAALAGAGYAYLARWNVENDIKAGRLESVLEAWLPEGPGLCLYYPKARHPSAGLRALIAFVETIRTDQSVPSSY